MYRLLLVDDEREILDWLYELFQDVKDLELDVYKALSGDEALGILGRTKIDVVVSDIKMPGLDGLQLLERIKARWAACRVVFLTGYDEFEYVYAAIHHEGVSYLLKTEDDEKIVGEVRKALDSLKQSAQNAELMEKACRYMREALPHFQREFMRRLLLTPGEGAAATQAALDETGIPLDRGAPVILAAGRFDRLPEDAPPACGVRAASNVKARSDELFGCNFTQACLLREGIADFVWLLQPAHAAPPACAKSLGADAEVLISGLLEALQDFCRVSLGLKASFSFCSDYVPWEAIEARYTEIAFLLNASPGMGGEAILNEKSFSGLLRQLGGGDPGAQQKRNLPLKTLQALLEKGDRELYMRAYREVEECLANLQGRNNGAALELYYTVATMLLSFINRRNIADKLPQDLDLVRLTRADAHAGWGDAAGYLKSIAAALFDLQASMQQGHVRDCVERMQQYIQGHLNEDLSLVKLAEISFFNPSYLSRLFKQATGQNLTDYISSLRIQRAKDMLRDYGTKIGDVSAMLGYESQHYFSRFFKKFTGLTPQEYRESIMKM